MEKERSFRDLDEKSGGNPTVSDIRLLFNITSVQSLSEGGLAFTLILINDSAKASKMLNPLDYLQVSMQDEEGWPVQLPLSKTRAQINTVGPIEIIRPYKVEAFENSLGEPDLLKLVGDKDILLKAGVTYKFIIRIDKVQDSDKKRMMARTSQTKPIAKGKYKINLRLSLLLAEDGSIYRQSESGYVDVELV